MNWTLSGERAVVNLDTTRDEVDNAGNNNKVEAGRGHFNDFVSYHIFHAAQKSRHNLLRRFLALASEDKHEAENDSRKNIHKFLHYESGERSESHLDKVFGKTALRWAVENEDT